MDEQDELLLMQIIAYSGNARSLCMEAMQDALRKDMEKAEQKVNMARESLAEAHEAHTLILVASANGKKMEISPIMIHAQDHFMGASLTLDLIEMMLKMQREILEWTEEKEHG